MDEDERTNENEELNAENDAREEDIVEDTDSDTRDVIESDDSFERDISRRIDRLEDTLNKIMGGIDALRDAQSIMVDNGATIMESDENSIDLGIDDFISPSELDLTI